jgi:hypothetical protein
MIIPKQALGARPFLGPVLASGQQELSGYQAAQSAAQPRRTNTRRVASIRGTNRVSSGRAGGQILGASTYPTEVVEAK